MILYVLVQYDFGPQIPCSSPDCRHEQDLGDRGVGRFDIDTVPSSRRRNIILLLRVRLRLEVSPKDNLELR